MKMEINYMKEILKIINLKKKKYYFIKVDIKII